MSEPGRRRADHQFGKMGEGKQRVEIQPGLHALIPADQPPPIRDHADDYGQAAPKHRASGLCYEFDLRPDFRVQFILPYDLSRDEANRIEMFIGSLPYPQQATALPPGLTSKAAWSPR